MCKKQNYFTFLTSIPKPTFFHFGSISGGTSPQQVSKSEKILKNGLAVGTFLDFAKNKIFSKGKKNYMHGSPAVHVHKPVRAQTLPAVHIDIPRVQMCTCMNVTNVHVHVHIPKGRTDPEGGPPKGGTNDPRDQGTKTGPKKPKNFRKPKKIPKNKKSHPDPKMHRNLPKTGFDGGNATGSANGVETRNAIFWVQKRPFSTQKGSLFDPVFWVPPASEHSKTYFFNFVHGYLVSPDP